MYSDSQASKKDMSLLLSSTFKHLEGEHNNNKEAMDSDHNLLNQQQLSSRLTRYRSAPSSFFANFINSEDCEEFLTQRNSNPEAERMLARFMSSGGAEDSCASDLCEIREKPQFIAPTKCETEVIEVVHQQNGYNSSPRVVYEAASASMESPSPYRVVSSMAMDGLTPMKIGGGANSNLIRHSSSPAGLFSHLDIDNGYTVRRGVGDFRACDGTNREPPSSASRLKNQINFSSGQPSSSGLMDPISEIESESMGANSPHHTSFAGYSMGSWDDSAMLSENFSGLKRGRSDDCKPFSALKPLENQNGETSNGAPLLAHHLSLPKASAEMAVVEKFLEFQDSVPCKIRAKRGCATHPRSIAERVRRTRISERMRKLQELVPNMDKQTNTSDMLDLAVDYIKDLQKQVKTLSDKRAKCTCSNKQKS